MRGRAGAFRLRWSTNFPNASCASGPQSISSDDHTSFSLTHGNRMPLRSIATIALAALWMANPVAASGVIKPYQGEISAPAFTLKDLDDVPHSLEDYRGKVLLVNFWASWCSPCIREMPGMQRLSSIMDERPFDIVAISVSERKNTVQRAIQRHKLDSTTTS